MTKRHGFTLIEIIVTLAVIVVILSVVVRSFNRTNSGANLNLAAEALSSDIRLAALAALNGDRFQLQDPAGWGVHFDPTANTYTVFADLDGDDAYDTNEKYKTVALTKNIVLWALYFDSSGWADGALTFRSPSGTPYFKGGVSATEVTAATGDVEVQLVDNVTDAQASVFTNFLGAVSL